MIYDEREIRHNMVIEAAKQMMIAARTAPKAKGGFAGDNAYHRRRHQKPQ